MIVDLTRSEHPKLRVPAQSRVLLLTGLPFKKLLAAHVRMKPTSSPEQQKGM